MIHVADIHLGRNNDTVPDAEYGTNRMRDTILRLREAMQEAKLYGCPLVMDGDVYDMSRPKPSVEALFFKFLNECSEAGVEVYIIPGNHDKDFSENALATVVENNFNGVYVIFKPLIQVLSGRRVLFIPHITHKEVAEYGSMDDYIESAMSLGEWDVLVSHAHVAGVKNSSDIEIESGNALVFSKRFFISGKIGIFGHIHGQAAAMDLRDFMFYYPGSVMPCDYGEVDTTHGYLRFLEKDISPVLYQFKTPIHEYVNIRIDLINKDEMVYDEVKAAAKCAGKLIKVIVFTNDPLKVDEYKMRKFFNKFGYVTKFETVYHAEERELLDVTFDDVQARESYAVLLERRLVGKGMSVDEAAKVVALGAEIFESAGVKF